MILLMQLSSAASYAIDLEYNNKAFSLISSGITPVNIPAEEIIDEIPYQYKIVSFESEILEVGYFILPYQLTERAVNGTIVSGEIIILDPSNLTIYPKYYDNAKSIEIYDANAKLLSIDVINYAKNLCGDGICQAWEAGKCFDCGAITEKPTAPQEKKSTEQPIAGAESEIQNILGNPLVWMIFIASLALIILVIIILKRKKESPYEFIP